MERETCDAAGEIVTRLVWMRHDWCAIVCMCVLVCVHIYH